VRRLLFLLPSVPDPPDSGAKLRNLALLKLAAQRYTVDAVAFGAPDSQARLASWVRRAEVVPVPPSRTSVDRVRQLASSHVPDVVRRYESPAFADKLRCLLADGYDLVQAEGIEMAPYLDHARPEQRVYDAHNAEFLLQRRASETADRLATRLYSTVQWRRLERFERRVVHSCRLVLAVSEHEANQLAALGSGEARIRVVPNAIDVNAYSFRAPSVGDPADLLFLGTLGYRPNAEAAHWLVTQVLPLIHARAPATRLFVVGSNPPAWLIAAGQRDPRIAVTGYVADERPYLQRCSVMLLPLRAAAGARLKALVAMASGLPILSTAIGMEGIEAEPGRHFCLAERSDEWPSQASSLLADAAMRRSMATQARTLVEQRYDWSAVQPCLEAAYAELAA
jgi:glycosyltransferase involved in cell wall biosynthesis